MKTFIEEEKAAGRLDGDGANYLTKAIHLARSEVSAQFKDARVSRVVPS
jgi:hypothetical protein